MKRATQINIIRWIIICLLILLVIIIGLSIRKKFIMENEVNKIIQTKIKYGIQFEELFREHQEDLQNLLEQLVNEDAFKEQWFVITFDEERFLKYKSGSMKSEYAIILYSNGTFVTVGDEALSDVLNENDDLKEALDKVNENGLIIGISSLYLSQERIYEFDVNTKYTPYIDTVNKFPSYFAYCEYEDCEKYGYQKIENNWYMYIKLDPE